MPLNFQKPAFFIDLVGLGDTFYGMIVWGL